MADVDSARTTAYLAHLEGVIAEYGWAVQTVRPVAGGPDPGPPFAYTVGLSRPQYGHPEFLVIGLPSAMAHTILNGLGERVREGERLQAGQRVRDLLWDLDEGPVPLELVRVDNAADRRAPLSVANWLYGHGDPVEALQVVWPDHQHRLPWELGYDASTGATQPLLGQPVAQPNDTIASECRCAGYADADTCGCGACAARAATTLACPHRLDGMISDPSGGQGRYHGLCDQCFEEARTIRDCGLRVGEHRAR